ncbi:MAG: lipoyl(octanoyl) transferase LipB [Gemmatimonadetes bacterium]|nr:lipoyl(octanoyl) transferase LipB [Gemmatimonadota bacterium]MYB99198.1 lipoyl(octanoyl) transferase LipB [Gemmatimonadota bacterium]MYI47345.1 lipoyl(octanoyl) transferase LipB [Gemmatimonadota bacterium]
MREEVVTTRLAAEAGVTHRSDPPSRGLWKDRTLVVRRLGLTGYRGALELQAALVERRRSGEIPDTLLLLEHPHVITLGSSGDRSHLLLSPDELAARGIEVHRAGRGGDVTYHGPGQLVGYPILDLKPDRRDLHAYLRSLEAVVIGVLRTFGIQGERDKSATGVWARGAKAAAIGIRVSSGWITSHGFAVNANTDLSYFDAIVPCGLHGRTVTSLTRLLQREITPATVAPAVVAAMVAEFGYGSVRDTPADC